MKVVLVDDEQKALDALSWQLSSFCPDVEVTAACNTVRSAVQAIQKDMPQAVFLDIEMPVENGFDLLAHFDPIPFEVIFTTAYDQFALKAIKFSALDYLLKPVDPAELQAAVKKLQARERPESRQDDLHMLLNNYLTRQKKTARFALPTAEGLIFLEAADIVHCESESNYTHIYLADGKKFLIAKTLKDVESLLEGCDFFRVHHSHLINIRLIRKMLKKDGGTLLMQNGSEIAIARNRKEQFMELFRKL
ncbi:MAG TPA: LytTR family DNA-binding domain-containing protein [Flavisolibacter sp.]|nr:LytTR family DNA-binding domain-containing protein [Flavisolibacter sp.]